MLLVNNPGTWSAVYAPLDHAQWHGLTFADVVFPFFLFAVGNSQALSFPKLLEGHSSSYFLQKIFRRSLIIFVLGFLLSWYPFVTWVGEGLQWKTWTWINSSGLLVGVRIMGVLQRIAIAFFLSSLIIFFAPRSVLPISFLILIAYWILCFFLGTGDVYSLEGWFGTAIDRTLLGASHLYRGEGVPFDPEGLMSTFPAIAQVLFGYWVGKQLLSADPARVLQKLIATGFIDLGLGLLWSAVYPLNKKIWTSSYVLVTTALGIFALVSLVEMIDQRKIKIPLMSVLVAFGKNPLFIFLLSGIVPKTFALLRWHDGAKTTNSLIWLYEEIFARLPGPPENGSLLYAIFMVAVYGAIVLWMDKNKIYFKI